jgi:hypothetical protein
VRKRLGKGGKGQEGSGDMGKKRRRTDAYIIHAHRSGKLQVIDIHVAEVLYA